MSRLLCIALGGGIGALLRYGLSVWVHRGATPVFPWATLITNVCGCFLMGFLAQSVLAAELRETLRLALLVGLLGGFTTFSSFGFETLVLAKAGRLGLAGANVLLSNGAGLAAAGAGLWLAHRLQT